MDATDKFLSMEIYAKINDKIDPTLLSTLTEFYYHGNMAQVTQVWILTPTAKTIVDETYTEKENSQDK